MTDWPMDAPPLPADVGTLAEPAAPPGPAPEVAPAIEAAPGVRPMPPDIPDPLPEAPAEPAPAAVERYDQPPPPAPAPARTPAERDKAMIAEARRRRAARRTAQPIDAALLWALVRRYLCHYVALTESQATLVTAWVFHACARARDGKGIGQLIWRASPRLLLTSEERGSGKSTLLDLIGILTLSRRGKIPRISSAKIAQVTGKYYETVLLDEARTIFGAGGSHVELQGCLLAGYTRRSSYEVAGRSLDLFGAVALAAKMNLITETRTDTIDDLVDRCLMLILLAPRLPMPEAGERADEDGALLGRALVAWTDSVRAELKQAATDIADEDYEDEHARAKENPGGPPSKLRLLQISRPLRACGRVVGPGAEEDVLTAIAELAEGTASAEARAALAEVDRRFAGLPDPSFADDDDVPEGGRVVFGDDDSDVWAEPAAPAWAAARITSEADGTTDEADIGADHADPQGARDACDDDAGTLLGWEAHPKLADTWTATIYPAGPDGPQVIYAVARK